MPLNEYSDTKVRGNEQCRHEEDQRQQQNSSNNNKTTTTSTTSKQQRQSVRKTKNNNVHFGDIEIYTFPQILGDNPGVSDGGVSLSIGWKHTNEEIIDLDCYEYMRPPRRTRRRLAMPRVDREIFLLSSGYSMKDIMVAGDKINRIKKERLASIRGTKWDTFKGVFEAATRRLKNASTQPKQVSFQKLNMLLMGDRKQQRQQEQQAAVAIKKTVSLPNMRIAKSA